MAVRCKTIPGTPGSPGRKSRIEISPNFGWNAGARSVARLAGPCRLEFTMLQVTGAACGLAVERRGTEPSAIDFALHFETQRDGPVFRALEAGRALSEWAPYVPGQTVFRIDRLPGGRLIAHAGATKVAEAGVRIDAPLITVGCLYASTDQIG